VNLSRFTSEDDTPLRRLDGRVKTTVLLSGVIIASVLTHWYLAAGLWIVATALFFSLRLGMGDLFKRLVMPLGIAWVVFLSILFTNGSHPLFTLSFRYFSLTGYEEGLTRGILLFLRIMAAVTLATMLSFSTPMIEILETLRLCKIPHLIIDIADMMYRYIFIIQETAHIMHRAQISRLGESASWARRVGDTGRIAGSILIRSLDRSTRIYQAMLARGYTENSVDLQFFKNRIPARDKRIGFAAGAVLLTVLIANISLR
jgi:cobalt/nickel transport system permease protein